ncbi:fibronectin type III domain-containing protein [Lysobacter sp. cf310]|uniref:fibronectin type III domain-containing protein n=1 Tax=Lysobacter sp. cf310 TaxID=1761790 RepID=UPI0008E41D5F|nr:fibronectin type III domain-containing protein [Lysobacter sp. cf310]SFK47629.1 hypothetical protein SAMN04487938_0990 [Lysobacter sp. cf310]
MSHRPLINPPRYALDWSYTVAVAALFANLPAHASCEERPGTPTDLVAAPLSPTAIRLSWRNTTGRAAAGAASGHTMYFDFHVRDLYGGDLGRDLTGDGPHSNLLYGGITSREFDGLNMGTDYCFYMHARTAAGTQGCVSQQPSSAACTATLVPADSVPNGCKSGYVWRTATPADDVCVTPEVRAQTLADNELAASRRVAPPGFNPDTCRMSSLDGSDRQPKECWAFNVPCIAPYVWRRATQDDYVCVPVETAQQAASDNARGPERRPTRVSANAVPPSAPDQANPPPTQRTCSGQLYAQAEYFDIHYSNGNGCSRTDRVIANSQGEAMMCGRATYGDAFEETAPTTFRVSGTTSPSGCRGFTISASSEDNALQCAAAECGVDCETAIGECP